MSAPINDYISAINKLYASGRATEHSYRPALKDLIEALDNTVVATNEPTREKCGAPDYIVTRKQVPVGYIEAKDIGVDLNKVEKGSDKDDQLERYLKQLENLILTDYMEFRFYRNGKKVHTVSLAAVEKGKVVAQNQAAEFEPAIREFLAFKGQTIKSAEQLAKMMAQKAQLMRNVIYRALVSEDKSEKSQLREQLEAFQKILIHDMDEKQFADMYSQTVAYGLFAARLHDETLEDFSRQEARDLVPKSNPFLRTLFDHILGANVDERIIWIVDALIDVFRACDIRALIESFGKAKNAVHTDPMIHFYETFLAEYDPHLRKSRGVYYTPEPVVDFIVRAVDDILVNEFDLPQGLADTSKIQIEVPARGGKGKEKKTVHRVQILDPATGTGTFLARVVEQIHSKFEGQEGIWSSYVEEHLKPRLNGFEILMAPYAMCHLKLDLMLQKTGYKPKGKNSRFHVYLTNALEEAHPDTGTLWATWLSNEASEANEVKRDTPVMVVLGNPPYSGISNNKGEWITKLIEDYKYVDGEHFKEKKHWLQDDYVKFIRYGEHFVEKNGNGILAFINNHGFINNPTFRGMRARLATTFDKIVIINLHGNSNMKERSPDGSPDENVFDIQQGVSINIFIRKTQTKKRTSKAEVYHADIWGSRDAKYQTLRKWAIDTIKLQKVRIKPSQYSFQPSNEKTRSGYDQGIPLNTLFSVNGVGIVTARDAFCIDDNIIALKKRIEDFVNPELSNAQIIAKYRLKNSTTFDLDRSRQKIFLEKRLDECYQRVSYRPFDSKWIFYNGLIVERPLLKLMRNLLQGKNAALISARSNKSDRADHFFISANIVETKCGESTTQSCIFPLYLYPKAKEDDMYSTNDASAESVTRATPNLDPDIVTAVAEKIGLKFEDDGPVAAFSDRRKRPTKTFAPIDLLDYIYGVLHSPNYREKYKELLKIDFPRVPYPASAKEFWAFAELGGELRALHLMESPKLGKLITKFSVSGSNEVEKISFEPVVGVGLNLPLRRGKVFINKDQCFDGVPEVAWSFYIGGYQPAQKWLKDRKGRVLSTDDVMHYQKIIVALTETARVMGEIEQLRKF